MYIALYPSVPTAKGPEVLRKRLLSAGFKRELVDWVVESTLVLLKSNTFEYDDGEGAKLYSVHTSRWRRSRAGKCLCVCRNIHGRSGGKGVVKLEEKRRGN